MGVAQFGRASGLGPEGRRFKSCLPYHCLVAQLVEHSAEDRGVVGAKPTETAILTRSSVAERTAVNRDVVGSKPTESAICGGLPKRS